MNNRGIIPIISFAILLVSCEQFVQIAPPENQVVRSNVFTNDATAMSTLNGLYAEAMTSNFTVLNGGLSIYGGLSADELYNRIPSTNRMEFQNNALLAKNSDNEYQFWRHSYILVYHANSLIEGARSDDAKLSQSTSVQIQGEALFVRALCYFYLTNLYGAVPLITGTDSESTAKQGREAVEVVYAQIVSDLIEAERLLPMEYAAINRSRPNKATVQALLARVHLYLQQWDEASSYSTKVIENVNYRLEDSLSQVFRYDSDEVIWQLYPANESFKATAEAQYFLPTPAETSLPAILLTPDLLSRFETGDKRASHWINNKTYQEVTYWYPNKYKIYRGNDFREEYNVLFRLAEQYLIRAEARSNLGDLEGALDDINVIRGRSGLSPIGARSSEDFQVSLLQERAMELFAECGHRWMDLKRLHLADALLGPIKGDNWHSTDVWYPVPLNELNVNPFLTQNEGYE